MVGDVLADEAADEVVAVVVAVAAVERERVVRGLARGFEILGLELCFEKLIRHALLHEQRQLLRGLGHELTGIPPFPGVSIVTEVGAERFFAPRHACGGNDGREGGNAAVATRVLERDHQRTVAPHRMTEHGPHSREAPPR